MMAPLFVGFVCGGLGALAMQWVVQAWFRRRRRLPFKETRHG
jgi:hypothetical protein